MFATVAPITRDDLIPSLAVNSQAARGATCQNANITLTEAQTWHTYLCQIREAIWGALAARSSAKRDYAKAQAEVEKCEKQLQLAVENEWLDEARTAMLCRMTWQDQAHHLKALVDKHTCQILALKNQLAYWENQIRV
ncbi:MAG: hypothetical protein JOZ78_00665 [Chroococcidiopsidaceae cyanobacterium CP_BM_ER_R8_30]|nr:hypothetical protein [Chroococcidiopsidaceae cyanobacterium CP_BM_ER_R8_30]